MDHQQCYFGLMPLFYRDRYCIFANGSAGVSIMDFDVIESFFGVKITLTTATVTSQVATHLCKRTYFVI